MSESRERFEATVHRLRPGVSLERETSGEYKNSAVWAMWVIWPEAERETRERCAHEIDVEAQDADERFMPTTRNALRDVARRIRKGGA